MKKYLCLFLILAAFALTACDPAFPETSTTAPPETTVPPITETVPETTAAALPPETTEATVETTEEIVETTAPVTDPEHSDLYIPGVDAEDVITFFNEVCLDAEFSDSGDPSLLQKWDIPIRYTIQGEATEDDMAVLEGFCDWLNTLEGFPGISPADGSWDENLTIHFCPQSEIPEILGDNFSFVDGGVTFWYTNNAIYDATICYRTDMDQYIRNSVILEEIFNGLGPVQDTWLREDSIAYAGYSEPQALTNIDELILKLLYHPDIKCGMNAQECEAVIRQLYY